MRLILCLIVVLLGTVGVQAEEKLLYNPTITHIVCGKNWVVAYTDSAGSIHRVIVKKDGSYDDIYTKSQRINWTSLVITENDTLVAGGVHSDELGRPDQDGSIAIWAADQVEPRFYKWAGVHFASLYNNRLAVAENGNFPVTLQEPGNAASRISTIPLGYYEKPGSILAVLRSDDSLLTLGKQLLDQPGEVSFDLWEVKKPEHPVQSYSLGKLSSLPAFAVSQDTSTVATLLWNKGQLRLISFDITQGTRTDTPISSKGFFPHIALSGDGKLVALIGLIQVEVRLLSGKLMLRFANGEAPLTAAAFTPEGDALLIGDLNGQLYYCPIIFPATIEGFVTS